MSKTLSDYITVLRPVQQDIIVHAVKIYNDKPDFHRGLLPFLQCGEAAKCLMMHLETIKAAQAAGDPEAVERAVVGEKFIRQIISVFRGALIYRLSADEESAILNLTSTKMKRHYGKRYGHKFAVNLHEFQYNSAAKRELRGMVELQMISRNKWKVTCHKDLLTNASLYLMDYFGQYS